ncbi:MAG TPA: nucleotidyltransferase family protein [Fontimonas sp.]
MSGICIVLLAAGNASRYGGEKLLEPFDGQSLIRGLATAALETGHRVLVVTGAYAERMAAELAGLDVTLTHHADWNDGMGTSIAAAFRHLLAEAEPSDAALVCPADLPLVRTAQLQRLIDAHRREPACIAVSAWETTQGAPCLFPRAYFDELARLDGPHGARALLTRHAAALVRVPMPEAAADIDTTEDYVRLTALNRSPR